MYLRVTRIVKNRKFPSLTAGSIGFPAWKYPGVNNTTEVRHSKCFGPTFTFLGKRYTALVTSHVVSERTAKRADLFDALAHRRRRQTLRVLRDAGVPLPLSELATRVARREQATPNGGPTDPERVELTLHHWHLPKLAESGLVIYAYSDDWDRVAFFTGTPEESEALSDLLAGHDT